MTVSSLPVDTVSFPLLQSARWFRVWTLSGTSVVWRWISKQSRPLRGKWIINKSWHVNGDIVVDVGNEPWCDALCVRECVHWKPPKKNKTISLRRHSQRAAQTTAWKTHHSMPDEMFSIITPAGELRSFLVRVCSTRQLTRACRRFISDAIEMSIKVPCQKSRTICFPLMMAWHSHRCGGMVERDRNGWANSLRWHLGVIGSV